MKRPVWDAIVVGGGPAGLSASMYLSRAGRRVLLIERERVGGRALGLGLIENYPGFPSGIQGTDLARRLWAHARRWGVKVRRGEVSRVERRMGAIAVLCGAHELRACATLVCTGTRFIDIPEASAGRSIRHGAFDLVRTFRGETVAVVGGGETAAHQALALSAYAKRVHLLHRGPALKAIGLLRRRLAERRNVEIRGGCRLLSVARRSGALRLSLAGSFRDPLDVSTLFILVGQKPEVSVLAGKSAPRGCFLAGDAAGAPRQVASAAADGLRAAMECERYLEQACAS